MLFRRFFQLAHICFLLFPLMLSAQDEGLVSITTDPFPQDISWEVRTISDSLLAQNDGTAYQANTTYGRTQFKMINTNTNYNTYGK